MEFEYDESTTSETLIGEFREFDNDTVSFFEMKFRQ